MYDYVLGKADWIAAGLATVRAKADERRALDVADRAPATCPPETPAADIAGPTLVVDGGLIVLGRARPGDHPPGASAEDVMEPGPATVRAHEPLAPLLERMEQHAIDEIVVTTPAGRLLGVVRR